MNVECRAKSDKKGIATIFLNDEPYMDIHLAIWGYRPAIPDRFSSETDLIAFFNEQEFIYSKRYTLKLLSAQSYHSHILKKKLSERLVTSQTITKVIEECRRLHFLNDEEWVRSFIRVQASRRVGPRNIWAKLRAKGIPIHEEDLEFQDEETQKMQIAQLLKTRFCKRDLSNPKERHKIIASLIRKGFDYELVKESITENS